MPSAKKKKQTKVIDDEDDILNELLLPVPEEVDNFKPTRNRVQLTDRDPGERPFKKARVTLASPPRQPTPPPLLAPPPSSPPYDAHLFDDDSIDFGQTPQPPEEVDDRDYIRFYWYDSCEDQTHYPGTVHFFGRIYSETAKRYVSCCTILKNIKRTCYLLINKDCTYEDAQQEFSYIIAARYKIKSFECKKVTKKYAFSSDSNIPLVADYVQVDYPADQPALPSNVSGQTFSHVFNTSQTPMEKIILDLELRGPCWIKLVDPKEKTGRLTWTAVEFVIDDPKNFLIDTESAKSNPPWFCALSICLRTYSNPITHQNEILAITGMVNAVFNLDQCLKRTKKASGHFLIMTKPPPAHKDLRLPYDFKIVSKRYNKTKFELVDSERDLLLKFIEKFEFYDPDIVVGHDLLNYDYETLVARMRNLKVGVWSKLGRFKRNEPPSTKAAFRYTFSGRVMCDIRTSAMELLPSRSYDMTELTSKILQKKRVEYNHEAIIEAYKSSDSLIQLLNATWEDNDNIFSILVELNVIPLALKITNITGNILSRTLAAGRSERNEYLLLHAFHEANFICPEKFLFNKTKKTYQPDVEQELAPIRRKAAYSGGLVLEPKAGYYDSCVLLMDFNSLYPSIIREYNICFSTVKAPENINQDDGGLEFIAEIPNDSADDGVLPNQLKNLVERRQRVKRMLAESKSDNEKMMLDIEQKALKLTANSMYGCLGFEYSRFYAKHLASLVTYKGREILMSTKAMVEKLGYEVIYGDTDSLMIDTNIVDYNEVIKKGGDIKGQINRTFKLLEIDIDGVYRPLLLLKKKNYAGTTIKMLPDGQFIKSIETKGLDTVRRDRAIIAKEAGERVLSMILESGKEIHETVEDIHKHLKELGDMIRTEVVPIEKFLISKQLNRNPDDYRDSKGLGHVTLAKRYNSNSNRSRKMKAGDTVEFVICLDGSSESANQRAYTLEEVKTNTELKLDHDYYLCQQIHPVMTRICDKLPITNAYVLAEMLGIEKSSMLHIKREESNDNLKREQLLSKGDARFNSCQPLKILCPNCNLENEINTRLRKNKDKKLEFSLSSCTQCNYRLAIKATSVVSQVISYIKKLNMELFSTRYVCENSDCEYKTRNLFCRLTSDDLSSSLTSTQTQPICDLCEGVLLPEMDDRKMDLQLKFLKHLFNLQAEMIHNKATVPQPTEDLIDMYSQCHREVDYALRCSFKNNVDVQTIFSMICSGDIERPQQQQQQLEWKN